MQTVFKYIYIIYINMNMKYIYDILHNDNNKLIIIMPAEFNPPHIEYIKSKLNLNSMYT